MSEKSLEDFFAKKDKSKKNKTKKSKASGKTVTKFTTTDEIAKKLTVGEPKKVPKKQDKKEKEKKSEIPVTEGGEEQAKTAKPSYPIAGDDEWNEFEDQNEKDYSGLKVQSLQISAEPEETAEEEDDGEGEVDENGDPIKTKGSGTSGPWNKTTTTPTSVSAGSPTAPEPKPEPKPEPQKPVSSAGKYVPPSRRAAAAMSSDTSSRHQGRQKTGKNVPQIQSDLEFPSLAASSDIAKYSDKNDDKHFKEVRKGGLATDNPAGNRPRLELENRYAALGN